MLNAKHYYSVATAMNQLCSLQHTFKYWWDNWLPFSSALKSTAVDFYAFSVIPSFLAHLNVQACKLLFTS